MTKTLLQVCDVCGKPATNWARDTIRHEPPGATYVTHSPVDYVKRGCDDHPVESEVVGVTQFPAQR